MIKMWKNIAQICAIVAMLAVMPYSIEMSKTTGITITAD
jgi:hypothetical protein